VEQSGILFDFHDREGFCPGKRGQSLRDHGTLLRYLDCWPCYGGRLRAAAWFPQAAEVQTIIGNAVPGNSALWPDAL
jgi:hypothetical protein